MEGAAKGIFPGRGKIFWGFQGKIDKDLKTVQKAPRTKKMTQNPGKKNSRYEGTSAHCTPAIGTHEDTLNTVIAELVV